MNIDCMLKTFPISGLEAAPSVFIKEYTVYDIKVQYRTALKTLAVGRITA